MKNAQGVMSKVKVYIVIEGGRDSGSVDSVWSNSIDADNRKLLIQEQGFTATVIARKVR
jgi:hypothetical protein